MSEKAHTGRSFKSIREALGIKHSVIGTELGVSKQYISQLEKQEIIEDGMLHKIADYFGVSVEFMKKFNPEEALYNNVIQRNGIINQRCDGITNNIDPIDKIVQLFTEKIELYERMLKTEQERNELLTKLLQEKRNDSK